MTFYLLCTTCSTGLRVVGEDRETQLLVGPDSDYFPDGYKCPKCPEKMGYMSEARCAELRRRDSAIVNNWRTLEAIELFQYLQGLGLPEEREVTAEAVDRLFKACRVIGVCGATTGNSGVHLEYLDFDDGTRMYFCASPHHGAIVYRLAKNATITSRILQEKLDEPPRNSS